MNNEEKILTMLEQLNARQSRTESLLDKLEQGQAVMQADMAEMKTDITEMKEVQILHNRKLDAIAKSINLLTQHSINISDRVMGLEQKVYGL